MDIEKFVKQYQKENTSFKKKLIFHLGNSGAGFYSEYNSMIYAMVYCYYYKIQFRIYSKRTILFNYEGYSKIFKIFHRENTNFFHRYFNKRFSDYHSNERCLSIKLKEKSLLLGELLYKLITGRYLTQDIFRTSRSKSFVGKDFDFPTLGLKGDFREIAFGFVSSFYKFNEEYENKIENLTEQLELPQDYIAMHIRGGDKIIEHDLYGEDEYIQIAERESNLKVAYVLTDDYSIYESLTKRYPLWRFYTLASNTETGYDNSKFQSSEFAAVDKQMLNLYASVEIIRKSKLFIGTCSSNVGTFVGMAMPEDRVRYIDTDKWHIQ